MGCRQIINYPTCNHSRSNYPWIAALIGQCPSDVLLGRHHMLQCIVWNLYKAVTIFESKSVEFIEWHTSCNWIEWVILPTSSRAAHMEQLNRFPKLIDLSNNEVVLLRVYGYQILPNTQRYTMINDHSVAAVYNIKVAYISFVTNMIIRSRDVANLRVILFSQMYWLVPLRHMRDISFQLWT